MENWKDLLRKEYLIGILLVLVGGFFIYTMTDKGAEEPEGVLEPAAVSDLLEVEEELPETLSKMYVDIKGAVKLPGMYEVSSDMRVLNVIDMAGGLTLEADDQQVNFSQKVEDQMVIYIPKEGEEVSENIGLVNGGESGQTSEEEGKVNLNQASKEELMTLNGVGEKKAEKIIEHREENGSFKSIEEIKNVNGFGEKTFESLKSSITI